MGTLSVLTCSQPGDLVPGIRPNRHVVTAIVYLMMFLRIASPEERTHLLEYGVVALLIHEALTERSSNGAAVPRPALLAVGAASLLGAIDECIQLFIPSRVFDPIDLVFNTLAAAAVAVGATLTLARVRRHPR